MEIYYQNETLYIELLEDLDELKYYRLNNKHYLRQMKQDFKENYEGDFYIR